MIELLLVPTLVMLGTVAAGVSVILRLKPRKGY